MFVRNLELVLLEQSWEIKTSLELKLSDLPYKTLPKDNKAYYYNKQSG